MSGQLGLIGRLWWQITRRAWREDTLLLPLLAAFAVADGNATLRTGAMQPPQVLSTLFACALATVVLLPLQVRTASVLSSARVRLLPLRSGVLLAARPLFGNPFRLALAVVALAWSLVAMRMLGAGTTDGALLALQAAAWTAAAVFAGDALEAVLRRARSPLLSLPVALALWTALSVLVGFGRLRAALAAWHPAPGWALVMVGGGDGATRAAGLAIALAALGVAAGAAAWAERAAAAETGGSRRERTLSAPLAAVARALWPWAPASFARELAATHRIPLLWANHAVLALCSAAAFSAGNPPLIAGGFLLWMTAAYNLAGPDVPMGGTVRNALLPHPPERSLRMRHEAVLAGAAVSIAAAFVLVAALRGIRRPDDGPWSGYAAWTLYGGSLFLLFTLAGDRFSLRGPRPLHPRRLFVQAGAGGAGAGILMLLSMFAVAALAVAVLLACRIALSGTRFGAGGVVLVVLASCLHLLVYAGVHLARHPARARVRVR